MSESPAQEFFRKGIAFAQAGDLASAESSLKQCITLDPKHALAMLNLGIVLMNRGSLAEAEKMLIRSVTLQGTVESISALATVFDLNGKPDRAQECYWAILKAAPSHVPSILKLAEISNRMFDRTSARKLYRQAWDIDPASLGAGIGYALASFDDTPAETSAAMDKLLGAANSDAAKADVYLNLLPYKEFHERMNRGLAPYHAASLDELFFKFAENDHARFLDLSLREVEKNPGDPAAAARKFYALFSARDRFGAEECLRGFVKTFPEHIYENVAFDAAFYRQLETFGDLELTKGLPPVTDLIEADFGNEPIAYLACNYDYFAEFAAPMIRSLAEMSPGAQVHLHVMDAEQAELEQLPVFCREMNSLKIAVSVEQPGVSKKKNRIARSYYHAIRFIRFYHHLKQHRLPLWLMDVDAVFNRDPRELYRSLGQNDAAFRARPGRLEPWNQFNACIVGAAPTEKSLRYFRLVAAYIAHFFQQDRLRWGIDQLAMYGVHEFLRDSNEAPGLTLLDNQAIDYSYREDGIVWCNSGKQKFAQIDSSLQGDPLQKRYIDRFRKYYRPM